MRGLRLLRLAWSFNQRAVAKFVLMVVLITVGITVFLMVSELSHASTDSLDDAISQDLGARNQYTIRFNNQLGLSPSQLRATTAKTVQELAPSSMYFVDILPSAKPTCPPYSGDVSPSEFVLRNADGALATFEGSLETDGKFDLCLGGQVIPASALRKTTPIEDRAFSGGTGLIVDGNYEPLIRLASALPLRIACVVQFSGDVDQADALRTALNAALMNDLAGSGIDSKSAISIDRADSGTQVRAASDGVRMVYGIIGWGVLLIVGLGILVAQLVILRDRTWLLGLARAVGARRSDIAKMVAADVAMMLAAGLATSMVLCVVAQPLINSFGQQAFHVNLQLLRWAAMPSLLAAVLLTLAVGAGYPMLKAMRLDPVEVLERR